MNVIYSSKANGKSIFYKAVEHLKNYNDIIEDRSKYYNTIIKNIEITRKTRALVAENNRQPPLILDPIK